MHSFGSICWEFIVWSTITDIQAIYIYIVTSSNVLRKGSLQTTLNAGLSEKQQEGLLVNVVSTK